MQFVPIRDGVGGSQRAWFLLQALAELGDVDLVLLHPDNGLAVSGEHEAAILGVARSLTVVAVPSWKATSSRGSLVHRRFGHWFDYLRMGSIHAPRLGESPLRAIAARLPASGYDVVFAARLPSAVIADALLKRDLLKAGRKVVDFDDVLSKFFAREAATFGWRKLDRKLGKALDVSRIVAAENAVLGSWAGVSVCSAKDVGELRQRVPEASVHEVPNVIERSVLAPPSGEGFTILFVGNLGFRPNEQGLHRFLDEAWPAVRQAVPRACLVVVGFDPKDELRRKLKALGAELNSNVPSVVPFYEGAHAVIAPIFFGGGTRIKLLEAMAFGRAIVSTPIGAEGLSVIDGRHMLIAGDMRDFAGALVRLAGDPDLARTLARNARQLQETTYGRSMMAAAVRQLVQLVPDETAARPSTRNGA